MAGFNLPVKRRTPFPLEEIANSVVKIHFEKSIDQLILPKTIKFAIPCHDHFEILFDEKKASKQDSCIVKGKYQHENFHFWIEDTPNFKFWRTIKLCTFKGQDTYAQNPPDSRVSKKMCFSEPMAPKPVLSK